MNRRDLRGWSPLLVAGVGTALLVTAVLHHANEFATLGPGVGPTVAVLLDGVPALGLVYAGYRLGGTDLSPDDRWRICGWCLLGAALIGGVMGLTFLVRVIEGRAVTEPVFPLLVATGAGGIAGLIAGYNATQARREARRARSVGDALGFVNNLIRHDLRNDLNVIRGHADLLEDEEGTESTSVIAEKADEALARIETTGAVAETLTGEPDLEPTDLAAITAEMATRIGDAFAVDVTTDLPDRAPVTANAGLRSVVDNLLENAAEHNDAENPRIHAAVEVGADTATLTIADNGPGIPEQTKRTLFEASGEAEGGLALVRTLVEGYGGEVWVEDNQPRGAVFVAELPRAG